MMENRQPLGSLEGASSRDTPERCPRPLYSQHCTEENHRTPQEEQGEGLANIKVEDMEEEETYVMGDHQCKEEEIPTAISTAEDIKEEEETDVRGDQQCKEEESPTDISTDGASNRDAPESSHPLYSQDCTKENRRTPQEDQGVGLANIKVEDIKREDEMYVRGEQQCKEEEIPTDISTEGASSRDTPERCSRPLYSQHCTEETRSTPQEEQGENLNIIKVEVIEGEEETYVRGDQQCKKEEIPTDISTVMSELSDKEYWTGFLEVYRSLECLWKVTSREYSNRELKAKAYQQLIEYCKVRYPQADLRWVKKKVQNFRTVFLKEHKRVKESQRSGAGAADVRKPTLWYYNLLLFTLDEEPTVVSTCSVSAERSEEPQTSAGAVEVPVVSDTEEDAVVIEHEEPGVDDVETPTPPPAVSTPPAKRRRLASRAPGFGQVRATQFLNRAKQVLQLTPGRNQIFGQDLAYELDDMDPIQAKRLRLMVTELILLGQRGAIPDRSLLKILDCPDPPAPNRPRTFAADSTIQRPAPQ